MSKTKQISSWIIAAIIAAGFTFSGITKLMGTEFQIKNLESWNYPFWFRFPIGLSELVLALAIMIPKFRKLTCYAIFGWAIGAIATHLQAGQAEMIGTAILIAALAGIILFLEREAMTKREQINAR